MVRWRVRRSDRLIRSPAGATAAPRLAHGPLAGLRGDRPGVRYGPRPSRLSILGPCLPSALLPGLRSGDGRPAIEHLALGLPRLTHWRSRPAAMSGRAGTAHGRPGARPCGASPTGALGRRPYRGAPDRRACRAGPPHGEPVEPSPKAASGPPTDTNVHRAHGVGPERRDRSQAAGGASARPSGR